jgi:hypothetical protein
MRGIPLNASSQVIDTKASSTRDGSSFPFRSNDVIVLQAETGLFLSREGEEAIWANKTGLDKYCHFTVTVLPGDQIALQADTGLFLSRIDVDGRQVIWARKAEIDPFSQFTVTVLPEGQIALQADTGKFLSLVLVDGRPEIWAAKFPMDGYCKFALWVRGGQPER